MVYGDAGKRESLIAPDAFLSKVGGEVSGASNALREAAETGDVTGAFEKAMKATVHGSSPGAAPPGRLFAIPKHMADEFAGHAPASLRMLCDRLGLPSIDPKSRWPQPALF